MDRLASVTVGIILEAMQIERGFLFLVDAEREADGHRTYRLRSARTPEERQIISIELDENGIIASYFNRELLRGIGSPNCAPRFTSQFLQKNNGSGYWHSAQNSAATAIPRMT